MGRQGHSGCVETRPWAGQLDFESW